MAKFFQHLIDGLAILLIFLLSLHGSFWAALAATLLAAAWHMLGYWQGAQLPASGKVRK
jgi:hypothetical protein